MLKEYSYCHFHLDPWVVGVVHKLEIAELEVFDVLHVGVQSQLREGVGVPCQLLFQRLNVVFVNVSITKNMNEFSSLQSANLSQHASQQ